MVELLLNRCYDSHYTHSISLPSLHPLPFSLVSPFLLLSLSLSLSHSLTLSLFLSLTHSLSLSLSLFLFFPQAVDHRGITPLLAAYKCGHVEVVEWLLAHVAHLPSDAECHKAFVAPMPQDTDLLPRRTKCLELIMKV